MTSLSHKQAAVAASADADARFDWAKYDRRFAEKMHLLKQSLAELDAIEAAISQASMDMARDVRGMIGDGE